MQEKSIYYATIISWSVNLPHAPCDHKAEFTLLLLGEQ